MKFTAGVKPFLAALTPSFRVAMVKSPINILNHVLVRAREGCVSITANNLDAESTLTVDAEINAEGAIVVSSDLESFLKRLPPDATFSIEATKETAIVKSGRARATIPLLDPEDFPNMPQPEKAIEVVMNGREIERRFSLAAYAAGTEETRFFLCGVFLHRTDDGLRFVGCDGHQLAVAKSEIVVPEFAGVIIPTLAVKEMVRRGADKPNDDFSIWVSEAFISLKSPAGTLTSKVIDGDFPDYVRVTPQAFAATGMFDRKAMISALNVAGSVLKTQTRCAMDFREGELIVSAQEEAGRESVSEIEALSYEGGATRILAAIGYVQAAVSAIDSDTVRVRISDSLNHVIFDDPKSDESTHLVMTQR